MYTARASSRVSSKSSSGFRMGKFQQSLYTNEIQQQLIIINNNNYNYYLEMKDRITWMGDKSESVCGLSRGISWD